MGDVTKASLTAFEKWELEELKRIERENMQYMTPEARAIRERRKKQAYVLWKMYYAGELVKQELEIPMLGGGACRREFLFSHKSRFAVE